MWQFNILHELINIILLKYSIIFLNLYVNCFNFPWHSDKSHWKLFLPCVTIQNKAELFVLINISTNGQRGTLIQAYFWDISFPGAFTACQTDVTDLCVRQLSIHYLWRLIKGNVELSLTICVDILIVNLTQALTKILFTNNLISVQPCDFQRSKINVFWFWKTGGKKRKTTRTWGRLKL